MSWLPGSKQTPKAPDPQAPNDAEDNGRMAMPPRCPRCDLNKAQFNRTIQNYQKAYRKKVEGLKTELKATRNTNDMLRKQVRQLRGLARVHAPSLAMGLLMGWLLKSYAGRVRALLNKWLRPDAAAPQAAAAPEAAAAPPSPSDTAESAQTSESFQVVQQPAADIAAQ